ncbi:MAG: glycosyltransferase [Propionibacteriaceae bacterium]|jgi:glycosyltransferase involved in cell wall biosynthesis|nr:glycosyltransferase [Propionibacteriaceae bacterium]
MKLSFCVPVHNRSGCLPQCLESLLDQTLSADDYEIIVVDDGSTDTSAQVAKDLFAARGFAHGVVHRLETNSGGASVPRNEAVRLARGDYLFFVDSDDCVAPELAERVWAWALANDADVVYVKYCHGGIEAPGGLEPPRGFAEHGSLARADVIDDKLLYATMVHKAFRRSRWLALGLQFDPQIRVYEDLLVTVQFLFGGDESMTAPRCAVLADQGYYLLMNRPVTRLHEVIEPLDATFRLYSQVLDVIVGSRHWDETYRLRAAAVIVNRIMRFGPVATHPYLERACAPDQARAWLARWGDLLARHLPIAADQFVSPDLRNHVKALRRRSRGAARLAVWIERLRPRHLTLARLFRRGLAVVLG